ncbi:MAG: hypothetical protein GX155_11910 [Smithella sp.]|jgi:REP element-mobilizing transposase RayT|nr:hypothetical protein [Smithella sp.]
MTRPLRIQYPDAYYHVTCRGNDGRKIFRNHDDHNIFFELLARSLDIYSVELGAYALMPNHFHFLVRTPKGNLSEFMRHFNISYTGAFNRKYRRSGHLYQGRYKLFLIKGRQSIEWAMLMELLYRNCNVTQSEIGRMIGGIDYSAVSQARKRLLFKMQHEPAWAKRFSEMQNKLGQMSRIKI